MFGKIKIFTVAFFSFIFFFYVFYSITSQSQNKTFEILSPLPQFLTKKFISLLNSKELWKPKLTEALASEISKPEITAKSAISYDVTNDKLIYSKNIKSRLPFASLTKIMTATIALENSSLYKKITVSKNAAEIGEDSMGLSGGETLSLEELLYGMILHSGNDASEAIAQGIGLGRGDFIYLMNKKAEELGLSDTHFTNPSGLEGDGNQYSTSYDLLAITRNALKNKTFKKIASTVEYKIEKNENHKEFSLYNETNLLTSYPGVKGVKTGYTEEAGMCLITYLEYEGYEIIAVLLNSENRRKEMMEILDYSLKTLGITPPPHS